MDLPEILYVYKCKHKVENKDLTKKAHRIFIIQACLLTTMKGFSFYGHSHNKTSLSYNFRQAHLTTLDKHRFASYIRLKNFSTPYRNEMGKER